MQKTFTKEFMIENKGCYDMEQLNKCSFINPGAIITHTETTTGIMWEITLDLILNSEISLKDKYWFVCKKLLTKEQNKILAIGVAEIVLEIYENKYPDNKAPRDAIQAAKDYLAGVIDMDVLRQKRCAADAVYAAAYAACAADAAACAAYAAYAACAAADAVYAAADAAYAACAAACAANAKKDFKGLLLTYLINFCNNIPETK